MTNGNEPINAADPSIHSFAGLTKREYFAAMALQGLLANTNNSRNPVHASDAVNLSDALIKALNETQQ